MADEWLIDGYNLLHAYPSGKSKKTRLNDRSACLPDRQAMLASLAGFAALRNEKMLVVLDGKGEESDLQAHRTVMLDVIYSQNKSADACIERILYERRGLASFRVVTDDRAIANIARGTGAFVTGTKQFMEMMQDSSKDSSETLRKNQLRSHGFNRPFGDKLKDT